MNRGGKRSPPGDGTKSTAEAKENRRLVKYTSAEKEFFEKYVPGHSYKEIRDEFMKNFGWDLGISRVRAYIKNNKLNTGRDGRFPKGNIPENKGKKMPVETYEKIKRTMFKEGNRPANYRPVGSERVNVDGYVEVKTKDPKTWQLKHRVLWELYHGEIPKGHAVIFRDNNPMNIKIDNLILVSRYQLARINRMGLSRCTNELKDTAVLLTKLTEETSAIRSNGHTHCNS